jgi:hypothetical protein
VGEGENGSVSFWKENGSNSAIGVIFAGSSPDPITLNFGPGGGHPPDQTYGDLLQDGKVKMSVEQNTGTTGSFTLLSVQIEVCGTLA